MRPAIWLADAGLFDIVNGFFNRCRGDAVRFFTDPRISGKRTMSYTNDYLAELNHHTEQADVGAISSAVIGGVDSQA